MAKRIVVLGGGFAGVESAIFLRKEGMEVTLVSDRDYMYIYPTSIWIPVRKAEFDDVCIPLEKLAKAHGFDLVIDTVRQIKSAEKSVVCAKETLGYDYLVVAIGAHKMPHPGIENTLSICGAPETSLEIRKKLDELMARGSGKLAFGFGGNPKETSAVRGGPGFELMFNVHNMLKKKGIRENFDLTFFAPMAEPGKRMGAKSLPMLDRMLGMLKIDKRVGKKISRFEPDGVVFEDGSKLESDFTMFIPAGAGHGALAESDLPLTEAGFIKIDDFCRVEGVEGVYAVGDVAHIEGPEWRAKQGHIAEVMARNTAHNIKIAESGSGEMKAYGCHLNILCVMDTGNGAAFVYRDDKKAHMIPLPFIGHWLKRGWGVYCRLSKLGKIPRIPGM